MRPAAFDVAVDGFALRGSVYAVEDPEPHPSALLLHGFGSNRLESGMFVQFARALASAGVTAVTYDRACQGESDGSFFDCSIERDIAHVPQVVEALASDGIIDTADLHLVGMSLGAVIATAAAAAAPTAFATLTLWSPAASFADEIGAGTLQGKPLDSVETEGYFDFYGLRLGPAFLREAVAYDVYGRARGYPGPVRVLHGDQDFIPAEYARRYREVYGDRAAVTVVPGADHGWTAVPRRDLLVRESLRFILEHARRASDRPSG